MRAALRSITSYEIADLASWTPQDAEWRVGIRFHAGPVNGRGSESFDLTVCSSRWLASRASREGIIDGRHSLIMDHFDWHALEAYLKDRIEQCEGANWREIAEKLARLGHWEFEDYVE